jgi:hypothetical protein
MKKFLTVILFLFSTMIFGQVDTSIYLGLTKKEIKKNLKENFDKVKVEVMLYVVSTEDGGWILDDNHYTYMISYKEYIASYVSLFTFDFKTDKCVCYHVEIDYLDFYYYYLDYFNEMYRKVGSKTVWYDYQNRFKIEMHIYNDYKSFGVYYLKI